MSEPDLTTQGERVFETRSPFSADVMDSDFRYQANCTSHLRKVARDAGFELTDIEIKLTLVSALDHGGMAKATETHLFEIYRYGERIRGVYHISTTIQRNEPGT